MLIGFVGHEGEGAVEFADGFDLDLAVAFLDLDEVQVGVLHGEDTAAVGAAATEVGGGGRLCAEEGLGEVEGEGAAADAGRAGEEIGVAEALVGELALEEAEGPMVAEEVPISRAHGGGI